MLTKTDKSSLVFPAPEPPPTGEVIEIAPGILWARIPLPFRLNHINVYLIDDGDGWAVLDTGIGNEATRAVWDALVAGPLAGRRLTRLIVTHFHPDHIGLAGWLCERFGLPLLTSQTSYLCCANISLSPGALDAKPYRDFYLRHGLDAETTQRVATQGHDYLKMVSGLPPTFKRLVAGDTLEDRRAQLRRADRQRPRAGAGDALLRRRQRLPRRRPGAGQDHAQHQRVGGRPAGRSARPLRALAQRDEAQIPADALVLPGHQLPFYGLHTRSDQLIAHHEARCAAIAEACRAAPRSAAELVPGAVPHRARPAPDELRLQRGAGARQLHAAPGRAGLGRKAPTTSSASSPSSAAPVPPARQLPPG